MPPTKSALRGSPCKCCVCHEIYTSRFTKCCTCHEVCTSRFTKCCAYTTKSTLRFTKCCACHETHRGSQSAARATKSANEPHVQKLRFINRTCHEIRAARRSRPCPKYCTRHKICTLRSKTAPVTKFDVEPPKHEVSLALATKSDRMYEHAHGTTTRAQSREALAPATQISRACAVQMHFDDCGRHECTVNSSELAVDVGALQRSKHQLLYSYTVRTPKCVHTVWGKKKKNVAKLGFLIPSEWSPWSPVP